MSDKPIAYRTDGAPIYDNTPTVVAVLVWVGGGILAIRRNHNPGKGLLGLPGGYHMRGETWQEAGAREVLEETGYRIDPAAMRMMSMETDEYGNNLVIAGTFKAQKTDEPLDGEAQEVLTISRIQTAEDWAFPRHCAAAIEFEAKMMIVKDMASLEYKVTVRPPQD